MAIRSVTAPKRPWIAAGAVVVLGLVGYFGWHYISPRESTDDAQVAGHVSPVAARVGGPIHAIHIKDNQPVKVGDILVEIDPRDFQIALARAEADLASAEAAARGARSSVPVTSATARGEQHIAEAGTGGAEAGVQAAEREVDAARAKIASAEARLVEIRANATRADQDLARLRPLAAKDEIPRQQFDAATSTADAARAAVDAQQAAVTEAKANLDVADARRTQVRAALAQAEAQSRAAATAPQQIALTEARAAGAEAEVLQARAAVEQAKANLERAVVRAPASGVISRRSIEVGQVVQPGQPLMSITTLDDVWVVANFKETQLNGMHAGQTASISVDAFDHAYTGHVDSIAAATGATFTLLPPDNASGNFVKVVQRVPVKILLDPSREAGSVLRPGMSVDATVYMK